MNSEHSVEFSDAINLFMHSFIYLILTIDIGMMVNKALHHTSMSHAASNVKRRPTILYMTLSQHVDDRSIDRTYEYRC